jgi:hypothetical protein
MTTENTQLSTPQNPISLLAGQDMSGIDTEKLSKLMELQERWEARQCEKLLADAMANFQASCPSTIKSRKSDRGQFASLDDIMFAIRSTLANNGLSVSFDTNTPESGKLTAVCHVMHRDGGRFNREVTVPVDSAMRANDTQKMGSAISYAKRYALVAALNIIVSDHDDDGQNAGTKTITALQSDELTDMLFNAPAGTLEALLEWAGVETLAELPSAKFNTAKKAIAAKMTKP